MKSNVPYLFYSRKFWLAVVAVAQAVTLHYFDVPEAIWQSILGLIAVLIGSIAYEDAHKS